MAEYKHGDQGGDAHKQYGAPDDPFISYGGGGRSISTESMQAPGIKEGVSSTVSRGVGKSDPNFNSKNE